MISLLTLISSLWLVVGSSNNQYLRTNKRNQEDLATAYYYYYGTSEENIPTASPTHRHHSHSPTIYPTLDPTPYPTQYPTIPSSSTDDASANDDAASSSGDDASANGDDASSSGDDGASSSGDPNYYYYYFEEVISSPTIQPTASNDASVSYGEGNSDQTTLVPTAYPTEAPTEADATAEPTPFPTEAPTEADATAEPTPFPTEAPTEATNQEAVATTSPTEYPTEPPTVYPSPYPTDAPTKYPTNYPSSHPTRYPTRYPTRKPTFSPTPYPSHRPTRFRSSSPTLWPTRWPTQYPTEMVIIYTDKEIFGFDVGSRAANIATLIALILVIIWLALSTAYCITRGSPPPRYTHHNVANSSVDRTRQSRDGRGPGRNSGGGIGGDKSRRQRFEEYWGEMDSSTNSITPMHPTSDSESDSGSIEISDRILTNQVDGQVLSSPHHAFLAQQTLAPLPPPPQPSPTYQAPIAPILPKPPSDVKQPPSQTSDLLPSSAPLATPPPSFQSPVAPSAPQANSVTEQVGTNSLNA